MHTMHTVLGWGWGGQAVGSISDECLQWSLVTLEKEKGVVLPVTLGPSQ